MGGRIHLPPFTKGIKTQFFQQLAQGIGYHIDTAQMVGVHIAGMQGVTATLHNGIGKGAAVTPVSAFFYQLYPALLMKGLDQHHALKQASKTRDFHFVQQKTSLTYHHKK
ncbi:hypothetical protein A9165_10720 [Alishewanella sp. HH-ZS]|nr:hypothetical protein A9165_10720 [Alishewanella sp. HH-ZS]